jgi:hypothetical protein
MNNIVEIPLHNEGVLATKLPNDLLSKIKIDVDAILKNKIRQKLDQQSSVGHITRSVYFPMSDELKLFLNDFWKQYSVKYLGNEYAYENMNTWMNIQKKYQYQPNHQHIGHYAWVIWVNIPYSLAEEDNTQEALQSSAKSNGRFEFTYTTILGEIKIQKLDICKEWEGTMILFPAGLRHTVYPFYTSDDIRVSVAGNLKLTNYPNTYQGSVKEPGLLQKT